MASEVLAISGTRRQMKEMVDGTLRVQIDIDPAHRKTFLELFPTIDMPVALAPLVADFEQKKEEKPKGGRLSMDAARICGTVDFQVYARNAGDCDAASHVRRYCGITSRAELDHNEEAATKFSVLMSNFRGWKANIR